MRVAGIVCEYNPFHNGHKYLIDKARSEFCADYVVCAISSSFLQRGEPSIVSKHARAEMAVASGADIVFEIPQVFSSRDAETYARAGVAVLRGTNAVTDMVFGSEFDDTEFLSEAAAILENPDERFTAALKQALSEGKSLAAAKGAALSNALGSCAEKLGKPNVSLALSYIRALMRSSSGIVPHAVKRIGEDFGSESAGKLASAAGIRRLIASGNLSSAYESMPKEAFEILEREIREGRILSLKAYRAALSCALSKQTHAEAQSLVDVSEGLENYIYKALAKPWQSAAELTGKAKTRRYTAGRLNRFLSSTMLGLTKDLAASVIDVPYLRLLAMKKEAAPLMKLIRRSASLPVITKPAQFEASSDSERLSRIIDARGQDIWSSIIESPLPMGEDFRKSPVIL
ncbi:MAG: nucleotidyltransferase family protein [Eubacteriales bacterium]|nr:nucleotidyltransferase family protein [Eubacteriales bacterium]MDD3883086.1 nucleotidyltransferase family protein [Eubacteriales bacterium]MDD4512611.1 nucleotidyltransferase family protein [Eubacteriales bacterium]